MSSPMHVCMRRGDVVMSSLHIGPAWQHSLNGKIGVLHRSLKSASSGDKGGVKGGNGLGISLVLRVSMSGDKLLIIG